MAWDDLAAELNRPGNTIEGNRIGTPSLRDMCEELQNNLNQVDEIVGELAKILGPILIEELVAKEAPPQPFPPMSELGARLHKTNFHVMNLRDKLSLLMRRVQL
jgi:hypothetical protein